MAERFYGSFDELMSLKSNKGGKFFKLKNGEEAKVRFMYDELNEINYFWVHEFQNPYAVITCGNPANNPNEHCKWCENKSAKVARVVLPIFNIDTNEVQYWVRTYQFVQERVAPMLQEVASLNQPLASQVYKIRRTGEGKDTNYSVVPTGQPDGQTKSAFGIVEDPYDLNIIRTYDYDYQANVGQSNNGFANNYSNNINNGFNNFGFGNNPPQATRRTAAFD